MGGGRHRETKRLFPFQYYSSKISQSQAYATLWLERLSFVHRPGRQLHSENTITVQSHSIEIKESRITALHFHSHTNLRAGATGSDKESLLATFLSLAACATVQLAILETAHVHY